MTQITEVPSPFCALGTDDLTLQVTGTVIKVTSNGCAVNTPAFEQAIGDCSPRIAGKKVPLAAAVAQAAAILSEANQPLIGGCASDVNGMRALLALADRNGAMVEHMNFSAAKRNFLALQDSGWMNTTLGEIKNRCDLFIVIACDLEAFAPRFYQRYLWTEDTLFLADSSAREVIYIGTAPSGNAATSPKGKQAQVIPCADADLPQVLAVLRALIKGNLVTAEQVGGIAIAELQAIVDKLTTATYGVVSWAAAGLDFAQAELTVQTICAMVKEVNASGVRCSGFPLGGKEGEQTAHQVCGWQTGYPASVRFSSAIPEYDPLLYDAQRMLAQQEADALLWVQAFNTRALPPPSGNIPTIVVARAGMVCSEQPAVFIPVGTPGIDHAGHAYRLDSVVAIRLQKLRESGLPSTAQVLTAIEQELVT